MHRPRRAASIGWSALASICLLTFASTPVEAQYFGQNKVQYRSFEWQVLESEHFELYFYESERKVAVDAARIAERAYDRLSRVLDHEFEQPIPLIIYASHVDFQSTNVTPGHIHEGTEGVTELMKRRVFLPFTGSYGEFAHVLEHELVHAFQLDILMGRRENVLSNPVTFIPPLWVMEGMAEYLSNGSIDAHTEMWLRDASLQGYLLDLEQLAYVPDIRVYRFGQAVFAYIGERFGDKKIGQILKKSIQTRSFPRAIKDVLGLSAKKLSEDWTQHVRRTYLPAIADHLKPREFARRLTNGREELSNFNLAVSVDPKGDRFVFISDRSLYNDLYLASAIDGDIDRRLVKGERTGSFESLRFFRTTISWAPNGREIALPANDAGKDVIVIHDVGAGREIARFPIDLDGVLSPSWAPDGERLVFTGLQDGHPDLYTIRRDGTDMVRLTRSRNAAKDPVWSPDGEWIAFVTDAGPDTDFDSLVFGEFRIGLFHIPSGTIQIPSGQEGKCINPQWSPDSEQLLFVSDRTGISNIYVMKKDGSDVRQLTNVLSGITGLTPPAPCISLSRDGNRLLFTSFSEGGFDVYAIDHPLGAPEVELDEPHAAAWLVDASGLPSDALGTVERVAPTLDVVDGDASSDDVVLALPTVKDPGEDASGAAAGGDDGEPGDDPATAAEAPRSGAGDDVRDDPEVSTAVVWTPPSIHPAFGEISTSRGVADDAYSAAPSIPDSSSFSFRDYRLRFSPDFVAADGLFASNIGVAAQTAIGFSDVLGNHQFVIGAAIYGSILDADVFLSYANLTSRTNWGVSLFQYRSDFVIVRNDGEDEDFLSQVNRGLEVSLSRPFNRFRRMELGLELVGLEEREFSTGFASTYGPTSYIDIPGESGNRLFVRPRIALVSDNVVYGSTGPISGGRSRFEIQHALGGVDFTTFFADHRTYLNTRQAYVFAFRGIAASSFGNNPQTFRIGGSYTLRGYDFGEIRGENLLLANGEFRFPLIDFVKFGWPLPIVFTGIRGLVFFDTGVAWDDARAFKPIGGQEGRNGFYLNDVKAAYGFGARMNAFGFLIARWDIARKTDLKDNLSPWVGRFSLGAEF